MMRVLFIDTVHPILAKRLEAAGFECIDGTRWDPDTVLNGLEKADGIVIRSKFKITRGVLEKAPQLKFIARSGSGLENIDLNAAKERSIHVFNSPEGNRDAVAEHACGMLLMLLNKLYKGNTEVKEGIWDREGNRGCELKYRTVGIIGYGFMGQAFAQRLEGFGCRILAHDKYLNNFGSQQVEEVSLQTLLDESDVISLHLPLSPETHHYCDEDFFEAARKPIHLINTSRGSVLKTSALLKALDEGRVLGAALDVLEYESTSFMNLKTTELPQEFQQLAAHEQVVLSPHVAGWTVESYEKLSAVLADKILSQFTVDS